MCGIAAIISRRGEIPEGAIERAIGALRHRGPDGEGSVRFPHCHLGHTRLSIIDLEGGKQPMTDESKRYWIVFNGEIYNYRELRARLDKAGVFFATQSDTEVILRGYIHYGKEVVNHLNGQFAFLIWDTLEGQAFLGRDRLGEKPLFWAESNEGDLIVASDIKAMVRTGMLVPRLDRLSIYAYLALVYIPPDRTVYDNVYPLKPGHWMAWHRGSCEIARYWRPKYGTHTGIELDEAVGEIRRLTAEAVRRQMVADVPVGAFLSGGLDSSTVVAMMAQSSPRRISTFSVGFGDLINELPFARAVAQHYGTDHHEIQMDIPVGEMLETMALVYDEPFADSSNIPMYLMSRFARDHLKVALSGDGADEIFGGYEWYLPLLRDEITPSNRRARTILGINAFAQRLCHRVGWATEQEKGNAIQQYWMARAKNTYPDFWDRHVANRTRTSAWKGLKHGQDPSDQVSEILYDGFRPSGGVAGMDRATDFDINCYLPGDILVKVDRAAMAHGLETRAPFLDVDLVQFVLGLPAQLRFAPKGLKHLLREACQELWPPMIGSRSKQGFGAPIAHWLQRDDVRALISRVSDRAHPLAALLPKATAIFRGRDFQAAWSVLCLGLWLEKRSECLQHLR